jgi:hypothetical protein
MHSSRSKAAAASDSACAGAIVPAERHRRPSQRDDGTFDQNNGPRQGLRRRSCELRIHGSNVDRARKAKLEYRRHLSSSQSGVISIEQLRRQGVRRQQRLNARQRFDGWSRATVRSNSSAAESGRIPAPRRTIRLPWCRRMKQILRLWYSDARPRLRERFVHTLEKLVRRKRLDEVAGQARHAPARLRDLFRVGRDDDRRDAMAGSD